MANPAPCEAVSLSAAYRSVVGGLAHGNQVKDPTQCKPPLDCTGRSAPLSLHAERMEQTFV